MMFVLIFIFFIWNSAVALETAQSSSVNDSIPVHPLGEVKAKLAVNKTEHILRASENANTSPKSESPLAPLENITENVQSHNASEKISGKESNDSTKNNGELSLNHGKNDGIVATEGGNSAAILDNNFQTTPKNITSVTLSEGGDHIMITNKPANSDSKMSQNSSITVDSSKLPGSEIISSMNKGKISPRKGVNDLKITNPVPVGENVQSVSEVTSTNPPLIALKNTEPNEANNSSSIHERLAKPLVTDGSSESNLARIKKVDYIVPIVCTAFSVPLLIVLAVYLYKKGADFWERRHYNRMDFLIEGIYNE